MCYHNISSHIAMPFMGHKINVIPFAGLIKNDKVLFTSRGWGAAQRLCCALNR